MSGGVAVVTGASRGLGAAVARALAKEDFDLAVCARRFEGMPPKWEAIGSSGNRLLVREVDVSNGVEVNRFLDEVLQTFGRIDVLVNNAGYAHAPGPLAGTSPLSLLFSDLQRCMEVNLYPAFWTMRRVLPLMMDRRAGVVVNVASKAARWPTPQMSAYSASKAALVALTQAVAKEVEGTGVRVVSVSPGGMRTEMREKVAGPEDAAQQQDPEFVAKVIADVIAGAWVTVAAPVPNGADILVWKGEVTVYPMEDLR